MHTDLQLFSACGTNADVHGPDKDATCCDVAFAIYHKSLFLDPGLIQYIHFTCNFLQSPLLTPLHTHFRQIVLQARLHAQDIWGHKHHFDVLKLGKKIRQRVYRAAVQQVPNHGNFEIIQSPKLPSNGIHV